MRASVASLAGAAGLALVLATSAAAQPDEIRQSRAAPERIVAAVGGAPLDRPLADPDAVELTAGPDGGELAIRATFDLPEWRGQRTVAITATAPFDKDKDEGGFALDRLTSGTALKAELTFGGLVGARTEPDLAAARAYCDRVGVPSDATCTPGAVQTHAKSDAAGTVREKVRGLMEMGYAENALVWSGSVFGKVGHESFDYLQPGALAEATETETPWSVGASLTLVSLFARQLATLKYEHQQAYKPGDEATFCPAAAPAACITGALGSPKRKDKDLVTLELRKRFTDRLGIAAAATWDAANEEFGLDVPVYLVASGKYGGGVRLAYVWKDADDDGDKDELKIGVFVRRSLNLF